MPKRNDLAAKRESTRAVCGRGRILACLLTVVGALALLPSSSLGATVPAPTATTRAATAVTYQSATLNGVIDPHGQTVTYYFQYGPTSAYGAQTPPATLAAGTKAVAVSAPISGLQAVTDYDYRLVAVGTTKSATGTAHKLKTTGIPLSLAVTAMPNPLAYGGPVTITGTLSGTDNANRQVVLEQNPYPYVAGFTVVGNPELTSSTGAFTFSVVSLLANTQFRVVTSTSTQIVSPVATETVSLGVTMRISKRARAKHKRGRRHRGRLVHFSGSITPAEPGARVAVQKDVHGGWQTIVGTIAKETGATAATSSYGVTTRQTGGGSYRVVVQPVEGGHVTGYSPSAVARLR